MEQKPEEKQEAKVEPGPEQQQEPKENFPIVGMGISAGGLDAFEDFFQVFPKTLVLA